MQTLKLWIERFHKSSVLWKQVLLEIATAVLGILAIFKLLDAAQMQNIVAIISGVLGGLAVIVSAIYKLYSGGNNATDTKDY